MHRDAGGAQRQYGVKRMAEALDGIGGQSRDEVGVDIVKAALFRKGKRLQKLCGGVPSADGQQHAVAQGLGIDADAVDLIFF